MKEWEKLNMSHLKYLLLTKGHKQTELCFKLKMQSSTMSRIVNGWMKPTLEQKILICKFLKIKTSDLEV